MNFWRWVVFIGTMVLGAAGAASVAQAQTRVGEAAVVRNEVVNAASSRQISVGDGVLRDETVRTGADSAARFVMADSTNLSLGANASLKLDRTVFSGETSYRDLAVRLTTGAFRFVTGHSEKAAYQVNTPLATIGVRGTILDILLQRAVNTVVLQEGAATVCTYGGQCVQLTQPGDTAIITSTGSSASIRKSNTPPWTFAQNCAAAAGLCSVTQFADAGTGIDPNAALCGR